MGAQEGIGTRHEGTVAVITIDHPPVNALPVAAWFELATALREAGEDSGTHAVVLRAAGRGFCAGVDIKELQRGGAEALVAVNRGCAAAFGAVYDCAVPVVAAVHGFCLGGGVGLVGSADVVVAASDATFGLPEVDRGALGAATHLARLVPQHLLRALYFTARTITADELHRHGSVLEVVPPDKLDEAALAVAAEIAAKDPRVIRAAKEALNGIDPQPVRRGYRFEQGFTYEMTLLGAGDEARRAFVDRAQRGRSRDPHRSRSNP
jgi:enoyl-CoA hydratase/carnithine racemase